MNAPDRAPVTDAPTLRPGSPHPLGATWDGEGVNFAVFSDHAEAIEVCLFDEKGKREIQRLSLTNRTGGVWHGYSPQCRPGQLYGLRARGPYKPEEGHRFNPSKLLLDPYARCIAGSVRWSDALFGYKPGDAAEDLSFDKRDSAHGMPKCRVVDSAFTWGNDRAPKTALSDTVLYELHVAGFTKRHPDVAPELRGTYAGLATPPVIDHLKRLGVTAVELLPIQAFVDDRNLVEKGLRNYWGYNTIGYFAPEARYGGADPVNEFKAMVRAFHSAGLEVILDVVYNHTGEGNHLGPTLSFRGLDNHAYYRLQPGDKRHYEDFTGCGNSFDLRAKKGLQLVTDSLRYWVTEMHVDGFRFDLATTLARETPHFDRAGGFLDVIAQDPVLSTVKLIAEPWDLGEGGYQVGGFPPGWSEWNDQYRDTMRAYWKGDGGLIGDFARRLTGSSDLYGTQGRGPLASVNFVTAHDGFTLHDLVSYNDKHNEANGEENRDGTTNNLSWNLGTEGPTDDAGITRLREQQKRNFLATLFLSQGVPMLLGGDEMGRTQQGNNNAYCQDSEIAWVDWTPGEARTRMMDFVALLSKIRHEHPIFRRREFFHGKSDEGPHDIVWLQPDGTEMADEAWNKDFARCLGVLLSGDAIEAVDARGHAIKDSSFVVLFNAHDGAIDFKLPRPADGNGWHIEVDTSADTGTRRGIAGETFPLQGRSLVLLRQAPGS